MKKKVFLMAAAALFSGSVLMAQTPQTPTSGKQTPKHEAMRKDMKSDITGYAKNTRQIRKDKQNLQNAKSNDNKRNALKDEAKLRVDKRQRHHDVKDMKKDVKQAVPGKK